MHETTVVDSIRMMRLDLLQNPGSLTTNYVSCRLA